MKNKLSYLWLIIVAVALWCGFVWSMQRSATPIVTDRATYDQVFPSLLMLDQPTSMKSGSPFVQSQLTSIRSIEKLFNVNNNFVKPSNAVTILVTGDVLLARSVNARMVRDNNNFLWPWEKVAEELRSADVAFINLETPLIENCPVRHDGMNFCGDARAVEGLKFSGIDVINFANNHAGNQGQDGVDQTLQLMKVAGIEVSGINGPLIKEVKGIKFAFLGYNDSERQTGINNYSPELMKNETEQAKQIADVVIVQFHFGPEYQRLPHTRQIELSHLAVDYGADLVVSNHPHWWQPAEFYNDKLIVYSHGNFIFDQMWSEETREGIVGKYTFQGKNLVHVEFLPIKIYEYGQPRWVEGAEKEKLLQLFQQGSIQLQTNLD